MPAIVVILAMAYFADRAVRRALDESLGERLSTIAEVAAAGLDPKVTLVEPGDEELRLVKRTRKGLVEIAGATHVERVLVLAMPDARVLVDSAAELPIGASYPRASFDASELERAARGEAAASVLFRGLDGRWYKTGYAPSDAGAVVVVHAPAAFFEIIDEVRAALLAITAVGLVGLIALAMTSARRLSVPLSRLSEAAQRIGSGALDTPIPAEGPHEAVVLGETMRAMSASLRARDEEMQMMLGGIAHEVRNPLGGIELFGSLLKEDLPEGDERREHVEKILKEIGVLSRVVNDFLDFARRRPLERRAVAIPELLADVAMMAQKDAAAAEVRIVRSVVAGLNANLDQEAMHRALLNLVRNAVQASPAGGEVRLAAEPHGEGLRFAVEDDGAGVPEEKRAQIFTPFFTTKQKGTGLGLALVRKAVEGHQGAIRVEASSSGGARFVLEIPARTAVEVREEPGMIG